MSWTGLKFNSAYPHNELMTPGGFVSKILTTISGGVQKDLWHLPAALDFVNLTNQLLTELTSDCTTNSCYGL